MIRLIIALVLLPFILVGAASTGNNTALRPTCRVSPLGHGRDDTDQVLSAISKCGQFGNIVFERGTFNITRKMSWNLVESQVDLFGTLSFIPDIQFWLDAKNTFRVVQIQSQASWFVVTGRDFVLDAHNVGGINGNGQPWWEFFTTTVREDGDGRPLSLTLFEVERGTVKNFHIEAPPFWCNAVANSVDVTYDGMKCNATNTNPAFFGQNIVPNTDGIDTYRSDRITMLNWDISSGDDCLAIKGNSSNIIARNITCRGGTGVAFGSLGQYVQFNDLVQNVLLENINMIRVNSSVQPLMVNGVYFKTWTGSVHGSPPTGGGAGGGFVSNVTIHNLAVDEVDMPLHILQDNLGEPGDTPSALQIREVRFINVNGHASTNSIIDFACSSRAPCTDIALDGFDVSPPKGQAPSFICQNTIRITGVPGPCNTTGTN